MPYLSFLAISEEAADQGEQPLETIHEVVVFDGVTHSFSFSQVPTDDGSDTSGPLPASKASIDAMPRVTVTDDCVEDCSICLDEMRVGSVIREMPCKHGFHSDCIEMWLVLHGSCPVCRFMMPVEDDGHRDRDGDGSVNGRRLRTRRLISDNFIIPSDEQTSSDRNQDSDSGSANSNLGMDTID